MRGKDAVIAAQLAAGRTQADAARAAGCSVATVERRVHDTAFRQHVEQLRADLFAAAADALAAAAAEAVSVAVALMRAAESEPVRLAAAKAILQLAPAWREGVDLERRIGALEAEAGTTTGGKGQ